MKHLISLVIKFTMTVLVLEVVLLLLSDASFAQIIYLSLVVTIVSYILGDLIILPLTNNLIASVADVAITVLTVLLFNDVVLAQEIFFSSALVAAIILAAGEWIFHKYLSAVVLPERDRVPDNIDELRR